MSYIVQHIVPTYYKIKKKKHLAVQTTLDRQCFIFLGWNMKYTLSGDQLEIPLYTHHRWRWSHWQLRGCIVTLLYIVIALVFMCFLSDNNSIRQKDRSCNSKSTNQLS